MLEIVMSGLGVGLILVFLSASVSANIIVYSAETNQVVAEYRDLNARFGAMVPPEGIQAMLAYADPPNGCGPMTKPPPNVTIESVQWAVLIRRFDCTFYEKVKNAQDAQYQIAIVHNVGSDELEPMSEDKHGAPIYITAVFIGERAGNHLRDRYLYNSSYFIEINNDYPFIIDNLLLPFAIVVGLCFFLMLGFMVGVVVKCIKDRRRARRHRLPDSSLKQIPTSKFHKGDPYETCAICLEDYIEGDKLRILPCSHAYHSKCIDPWLTRKRRVCPVCKRKVFAADEVPHQGSLSDSDTDSDMMDDTTPLIRPNGLQTNGGTFSNHQENPLLRSQRATQERRNSLSSVSTVSDDAAGRSSSSHIYTIKELTDILNAQLRDCEGQSQHQDADVEEDEEEENARSFSAVRSSRWDVMQGREAARVAGVVSLPINATVEHHQEVPTVIAGTSGSDDNQQPSNTSIIMIKKWLSWKRSSNITPPS